MTSSSSGSPWTTPKRGQRTWNVLKSCWLSWRKSTDATEGLFWWSSLHLIAKRCLSGSRMTRAVFAYMLVFGKDRLERRTAASNNGITRSVTRLVSCFLHRSERAGNAGRSAAHLRHFSRQRWAGSTFSTSHKVGDREQSNQD